MLVSQDIRARRRGAPESGAAAVELALVLPIPVALLLGPTTAGVSYTRTIGLTTAVRERARFAATADATGFCVQLWEKGTGSLGGSCSPGSVSPPPSLPTSEGASPAVPAEVPAGACVVRVIAARNFTIDIGAAPAWTRVNTSHAVARYEQAEAVLSCTL